MNTIFTIKHPAWSLQEAAHSRHLGLALYRMALDQPADPAAIRPNDPDWPVPPLVRPAIKLPLKF